MGCFTFSLCKSVSYSPETPINKTEEDSIIPVPRTLGSVQIFSLEELRDATQGFRSSNKIGAGGFGLVYKGRLQDGSVVAMKELSAESKQGEKDFIAEILAMSRIRHENVVKLLGGCVEGKNRILVCEYMGNNSLAQILLGGEQSRVKLNWKIRREICLGIAKGLAYLHEDVKPHIVHRDIKAGNILLDQNFTARISDFGLSKLFPDNITHLSTRVAGTLGYIAPEYGISGHLTRKSDVYSYGVLLLEILTGRSAVDFDLELGEYNLVDKAWEMYKAEDLVKLMDTTLKGDFPEAEAVMFLKVGLFCVQGTPGLRPKMSAAMKMLSGEMDIKNTELTRPGIITDLMKLKIASRRHNPQIPLSNIPINQYCSKTPLPRFFKINQVQCS